MQFFDEFEIAVGKDQLWEMVSDPGVLMKRVPGVEDVTKESEGKFDGDITRSVAGITLQLDGQVNMTQLRPPNHVFAELLGEDERTKSRMDGTAEMKMRETEEGTK